MTRLRKQAEDMTQQAETTAPTWKPGDRCHVFLNGTTYEGLVLSAKGRNTEKQCQWVQVQLSQTVPDLDGQPRIQTWVHPTLLPASRLGQPGEQPGSQAEAPYLCVTKKIKLEISKRDTTTLEFMQGKCRGCAL